MRALYERPSLVAMRADSTDPRHGTANGYTNCGCRCDRCRVGHAAFVLTQRHKRPALAVDDPRHGKATTYQNWMCRCRACTTANTEAKRNP